MTNEYTKAAQAVYDETKAALQLVYDNLNQGQQKKLLKENTAYIKEKRYIPFNRKLKIAIITSTLHK